MRIRRDQPGRFSTLSLCCAGILIVSGISNSWLLVGSFYAIFTTAYGRLLLFKLALFCILVGFGGKWSAMIRQVAAGTHVGL
jgi:putative copper resistance protein D